MFSETRMGHEFFEVNVPKITGALERIADALEAREVSRATGDRDDALYLANAALALVAATMGGRCEPPTGEECETIRRRDRPFQDYGERPR